MKKIHAKGQGVTVFIILGILIFIVLLIYYLYSEYSSPNRLKFEKSSIASYIQGCLDKTSGDGLIFLGQQGLYMAPNDTLVQDISFLLKANQQKLPTQQALEQDLAGYVQENLLSCLENFAEFERLDWTVTYEQPKAKASLNLKDVSFSVNFPVNVRQQDLTISLNQFSARHDVRLLYLYEIIEKMLITLQQEQAFDLTELTQYDINLTAFPYNATAVYAIEDPESILNNKPYLILFAVK